MGSSKSYTIYIFMRQFGGNHLYALDIIAPRKAEDRWKVKPPRWLHYIYHADQHGGMGCGKLGSKLYFLGGLTRTYHGEIRHPTDVQVFSPTDPASPTVVQPMKYCKYQPLMFEVNRKLYVLGGDLWDSDNLFKLRSFEVYDPTTDQWEVLELPPLEGEGDEGVIWTSCYVVNSSRVIVELEGTPKNTVFIFNPRTSEWSRFKVEDDWFFGLNPLFVKDSFYAAIDDGTYFKSGPLSSSALEGDDDELLAAIGSLDLKRSEVKWGDYYLDSVCSPLGSRGMLPGHMVCHLGHRLFCLLGTTPVVHDIDRVESFERIFTVVIHEDLQVDQGKCRGKCLYSGSFIVDSEFPNHGILDSCHVMSNQMQKGEKSKRTH